MKNAEINIIKTLTKMGFKINCIYRPTLDEKATMYVWNVKLMRNNKKMLINFKMGLAHTIPTIPYKFNSNNRKKIELDLLQRGQTIDSDYKKYRVKPPTLAFILYCIVLDTNCVESRSFNVFCSDFAYDNDSINALNIYNLCKKQAREFKILVTDAELTQLQDLFQDY
jgi:hypothetical protein